RDGLVMSSLAFDVTPEAAKAVEDELGDQALRRLKDRAAHIAATLEAEINRRMTAALERAHAVPDVAAATGGYSVYQEKPEPQASPRWHGVQSVSLSARDAAAVLGLAGALQRDGLVMSSLTFDVTPEAAKAVEDELGDQALRRLKDRAAHIAATLGLAVGQLRDLRVGNATGAQPLPRLMMAGAATGAPPPAAEPGDAVISVTVDAEVLLVKPAP
ncbi:MAG TPA: SIMPL domain-containing protein, partial [Stellaceae bacterium]|nr:SIMPL domain-containing protein [Stellaceae bacterium]